MDKEHPVILFDGICNFCNSSVNFIIQRDKKDRFRFAPLQSERAKELTRKFKPVTENLRTIILIEDEKYYAKTSAALRIARRLGGLWKLFYVFIIVPPFIRNIAYSIIVKYRYRWFGKTETCRMPAPDEKDKFLS